MTTTEIIIIVFGVIGGLYLLLMILDLIFVFSFRSIFKKHNTALGVMLHTKYDNIKKIIELLNKLNITIPFEYIEVLNSIDANSFKDQELPECVKARNDLAYLKNELVFMIKNDEILSKNLELKRAMDAVVEMDSNYRTLVAMYNADVLGYNYWINFLLTRYLKYIFKFKKKQMI